MQVYELGYLILGSFPEESLPEVVKKIKSLISNEIGSEDPIKIDLAYTMTKSVGASSYVVDEAYFGWIKFDLPAEASAKEGGEHPVENIRAKLSEMSEVLRFILIKASRENTVTFAKVLALKAEQEAKEEEEKN